MGNKSSLIDGGWFAYFVVGLVWVILSVIALMRIVEAHNPQISYRSQHYNLSANFIRKSTNILVLLIALNELVWLFLSIPFHYHTANDLAIRCLDVLCYLMCFCACLAESMKKLSPSFQMRIVYMFSTFLFGVSWYGNLYLIVSKKETWGEIKLNNQFQGLSISFFLSFCLSFISITTPMKYPSSSATQHHHTLSRDLLVHEHRTMNEERHYYPVPSSGHPQSSTNSSSSNHHLSSTATTTATFDPTHNNFSEEKGPECTEPYASIYSVLSYSWVDSILKEGMKQPLEMKNIFELVDEDKCDVNADIVEAAWIAEVAISTSKKSKEEKKEEEKEEEDDVTIMSASRTMSIWLLPCRSFLKCWQYIWSKVCGFCSSGTRRGNNNNNNNNNDNDNNNNQEGSSMERSFTLFKTLFIRGYGFKFIYLAALRLVGIIVTYAQPLVMYQIIKSVSESDDADKNKGVHILRMVGFSLALFALNFASVKIIDIAI
jgi:hypothetical protein